MKQAPLTADSGPVCKRPFDFGDIVQIRTVSQFRLILASWEMSFLVFLGSLFHMPPKASPKGPKRLPQGVPGGDFEGKGGIPKVIKLRGRPPPHWEFTNPHLGG